MHVIVFFTAWVLLLLLATAVLNMVGHYLRPRAEAEHQRAIRATAPRNLTV